MGFLDPLRAENNHGRIGWGEHSVRAVPAFHEARPESSPYQPGGDSIAGTAMTSLVTAIPSIPWSTPAQPWHFSLPNASEKRLPGRFRGHFRKGNGKTPREKHGDVVKEMS